MTKQHVIHYKMLLSKLMARNKHLDSWGANNGYEEAIRELLMAEKESGAVRR